MDQFYDGHHVRLRSRDLGTYLHADDDGEGVSLRDSRASMNAAWAVHFYHADDDDDTPYVLLHSAAYGRYLAATDASAPRGCIGFRVAQRNYDHPHQESIRWQAIWMGSDDAIMLLHAGADDTYRYLRANRRYLLRWNNAATVDYFDNLSTMMYWVVEPIPARQGMPALPAPLRERLPGDLSVVLLGLPVAALQLIWFVRATDEGFYNQQGWSAFQFRGRSVQYLRNELATRVDGPDFIMCVRAGRYGRLTPLVVNLPSEGYGDTIEIVVIMGGTPASAELGYPDVDAEPIPARQGMPALPGPVRERLPGDLPVAAWQLIRFVRATDEGFWTALDLLRLRLRGLLVRLRLLRVCNKQAETAPDDTIAAKKSADKKQRNEAAKKAAAAAWKQRNEAAKKAAAAAEATKNQAAEAANKQVAETAKKAAAKKREAEAAKKARAEAAKKKAAEKQAKKKAKNGADLDGDALDKADLSCVHHARAAKEDEETAAHQRYWEQCQKLKKIKVTPCLICFLHGNDKVVGVKNEDRQIDRHVDELHKSGVVHCQKDGCYVFGRNLSQIGMHEYQAHRL